MKCILCNQFKSSFFDNYKLNVQADLAVFKNIKIYKCKKCDIGFCHPMPKIEKLDEYYSKIYRSPGRPHYINRFDLDLYSNKNLNYIQYLTTFLDFTKLNSIFDFGSGPGALGFLLKKKFPHLKLFSSEADKHCIRILKSRGYKVYKNLNSVHRKFDLIISTHSLEHMSDLQIIQKFKNISKKNSHLFIEVPNCPLDKNYIKRPYDSPHLIFFTFKSCLKLSKKFKMKLVNLNYASYSIKKSFQYMNYFKIKYNKITNGSSFFKKIKELLKKIIPKKIYELKSYLLENEQDKLDHFVLNKSDSWCIRGLFKIN